MEDGAILPERDLRLAQYIESIRLFFRDFPDLNRLIQGQEHSDRLIAWAIIDALDDFNSTPPFIGNFPLEKFPSASLLLRGAAVSLLQSLGLLMTRNQISFNDGGISLGISDKTPLIMSWITLFSNIYEEKKTKMKMSLNIESSFGSGISSEYSYLQGIYGTY